MRKILRGSAVAFALNSIGLGLGFLLQIILARVLNIQEFGDYYYVIAWVNILMLFTKFGLDGTSKKFLSAYYSSKNWERVRGFISFSFKAVFVANLIVFSIVTFSIYMLNVRIDLEKLFLLSLVLVLFNSLLHINAAHLQAIKKVAAGLAPQQFLKPTLFIATIVTLYYLMVDLSAQYVISVNIIVTALAFIVSLFFLKKEITFSFFNQEITEWKKWSFVAIPLLLNSGMHVLMGQTDVILLGLFIGTESSGIYTTAAKLSQLCVFGLTAVNIVLAPIIAQKFNENKFSELQKDLTKAAIISFGVSLSVFVAFILLGKFILSIYGFDFLKAFNPLIILAFAYTLNAFFGTVSYLLMMTKYHKEALLFMLLAALINIILNILLIHLFELGLIGAAIATSISMVFWNIAMYFFAISKLKLDPSLISLIKYVKS